MSLTKADIAVFGPFDIDFKAAVASVGGPYTGLKPDTFTFTVEEKLGNVVFEDGDEEDWSEGLKLVGEMTISELVTADIIAINTADNFVLTQANGAVLTFATTCRLFASVDNGKTKIQVFKTAPIGSDIEDIFVKS